MRIERAIYSVLVIAASLVAVINWRKAAVFQMDNEDLREQVQALQVEVETAARLAQIAKSNSEMTQRQTTELMQLRNEVTQLRSRGKTAEALAAENQTLKTQLLASRTVSATDGAAGSGGALGERDSFPRESWTFAGYDSPESALVSAIWAMKEGNPETYLNSLAPQEQERLAKIWQEKSETEISEKHRNDVSTIKGLRVLERQNISPTEIVMNVFIEGPGRMEKIRMNQVGQEWKFGGFIRDPQPVQRPPQIQP